MDHPHSEMLEEDDAERAERPKKKRMRKWGSVEVELDSCGDFTGKYDEIESRKYKRSALSGFRQLQTAR